MCIDRVHCSRQTTSLISGPSLFPSFWTAYLSLFVSAISPSIAKKTVMLRARRSWQNSGLFRAPSCMRLSFHASRSANPRNSLPHLNHTFLTVERYIDDASEWILVATDDDLNTRFLWKPFLGLRVMPCSKSMVTWMIEEDTPEGLYRICHAGHAKRKLHSPNLDFFRGCSSRFAVQRNCDARRVEVW